MIAYPMNQKMYSIYEQVGGKKELSKEKLEKIRKRNVMKIIKSLRYLFREHKFKRSKYVLGVENSLYLNNLSNELNELLLYSKDLKKHKIFV
jgi:hypothetical protein